MASTLPPFYPNAAITEDNKLASNWFQQWLSQLQQSLAGTGKTYAATTSAPSATLIRANYRQIGDLAYIDVAFSFSADGVGSDYTIALPKPSAKLAGVFPAMFTDGGSSVWKTARAYIAGDGLVHFGRYDGAVFAAGTSFIQVSGSYQV